VNRAQYDAYIAGQHALGRDTSELLPGIGRAWSLLRQAERAAASGHEALSRSLIAQLGDTPEGERVLDQARQAGRIGAARGPVLPPLRRAAGDPFPFGGGFTTQRMPRWRRWWLRLRGYGM
jgi:hypothetical protein